MKVLFGPRYSVNNEDGELHVEYTENHYVFGGGLAIALGFLAFALPLGKPLLSVALGAMFAGTGVFFVMSATRLSTVISKRGTVTRTRASLVKGKSSVQTFQLDDIASVDFYDYAAGGIIRITTVSLNLKDGTRVKVLAGQYVGYSFLRPLPSPVRPSADQIAGFLGVPVSLPSPGETRPLDI